LFAGTPSGNDTIFGGKGDDLIGVSPSLKEVDATTVYGNLGSDTIVYYPSGFHKLFVDSQDIIAISTPNTPAGTPFSLVARENTGYKAEILGGRLAISSKGSLFVAGFVEGTPAGIIFI
jgi:hypothetical protein